MTTVDLTSRNDLPMDWLELLQKEFRSERISDEEMCATLRQVRDEYQYTMDPHTAVAFCAAQKMGYLQQHTDSPTNKPSIGCTANDNVVKATTRRPVILLSTASPCKFQEAVTAAIGESGWNEYFDKEFPARAKALMELKEREPYLYKAKPGGSLEESQDDWEKQASSIIASFGTA
jgi:threonine synthase